MRHSNSLLRSLGLLAGLSLLLVPLACEDGGGLADDDLCGDGIDNDNDGTIDEGIDEDGDTYRTCDIEDLIDCDDSDPAVHPSADEICDGKDTDCNGSADDVDLDGDGIIDEACGGADCDDNNDDAYPGNSESCDGDDNDCDGEIDNGFDADDDGFTFCGEDGVSGTADDDCRDSDPFINPAAAELCDGIDNDCDCTQDSNGDGIACGPGDAGVDEAFDQDGDGFVDATDPLCLKVYGPGGAGAAAGDCNDTEATIYPGAPEVVGDGIDSDCNGADN
jgi:hypothetical protein